MAKDSKIAAIEALAGIKADSDSTEVKTSGASAEEVVETEKSEDETAETDTKDDTQVEETQTEDTDTKEDSQDDTEEEADSDEFTPRFTQFKADTLDDYATKLETAYANSSTESQRLASELKEAQAKLSAINAAAQADPTLAQSIDTISQVTGPLNPALAKVQQDYERQQEADFNTFLASNPEVTTDPALSDKLLRTLPAVAKAVWETEKRQVDMKEALTMASTILGIGKDTKDDVNQAVKSSASMSKTTSKKKESSRSNLTEAQLTVAKRMGLTADLVEKYNPATA